MIQHKFHTHPCSLFRFLFFRTKKSLLTMVAPRLLAGGIAVSLASWFDPVSSKQMASGVAIRIEECWDSNDKTFVLPIYQTSPPKNLLYPIPTPYSSPLPFPYINENGSRAITYFSQNSNELQLVLNTEAFGASTASVGDSQICIQSADGSLTCNTRNSGVCGNTNEWTINNIKLTFPPLTPTVPNTCNSGTIDPGGICQFSGNVSSVGLDLAGVDFTVKYFLSGGNSSDHEIMCARISACKVPNPSFSPVNPCPNAVSRSIS
jgi:hypothetical protein